jgi:P-type E1-E2 ATPase
VSISVDIPDREPLRLSHLVLDLNGTLTNRGVLLAGVRERLAEIGARLEVHVLSADTFGALGSLASELGLRARLVATGDEKARYVAQLGADTCAAIGNGANDAAMLEEAAIGIAVVGPEGAAGATVRAADVVCGSIADALELLLDARALVATLRL